MIECHAISHRGGRAENQDRVVVDLALGLFAVADGMGGHLGGALAAELAVAALRRSIQSSLDRTIRDGALNAKRLAEAIELANTSVLGQAQSAPDYTGMGSTVAAILLSRERAVVGNVGDSRVYLFREGKLVQLTLDDTLAQSPLGELIQDEDSRNQMRSVLMQAVGLQDTVDVHISEVSLRPGDLLLLCSDGLHATVDDARIGAILFQGAPVRQNAEGLVAAALEQNASDNVSVILLGYNW